MNDKEKEKPTFLNWLGLSEKPDLSRGRPLGALLGAVVVAMLLTATGAAFAVLISTYWQAFSDSGPSLGAGTLIIGLLGAPFLIWRTLVAQRTVDIADASLFNEKLADALDKLAARRQVSRVVKDEEDRETVVTEWEDDIVTRVTAIDRLFGLVEERPTEAGRVATVLSTYVREISREVRPQEHPRTKYLALKEGRDGIEGLSDHEIHAEYGIHPDSVTLEEYVNWAKRLESARSDIEKAAQVLGKLQDIPDAALDGSQIDLSSANLQGANLIGSNFRKAQLYRTRLEGASLIAARWEGANLESACLDGVNLTSAHLKGAYLSASSLRGSNIKFAHFEGSECKHARLEMANLFHARLQHADLSFAKMNDAELRHTDLREASFSGANLDRAFLEDVQVNEGTDFRSASLVDVAVREMDFSLSNLTSYQVNTMFGDGSVFLADGQVPRISGWPDSWPMVELELTDFFAEYRKWLADPDTYTPPDPPAPS